MLVKILFILLLIIIIRTVLMGMSKIDNMQESASKKKNKDDKDIIDAEYTIIDDEK